MIKKIIKIFINLIQLLLTKRIPAIVLLVVLIVGISGSYYYYAKYKEVSLDSNLEAQKETQLLVATVGKIMELPTDEVPTVANIVDKTKLNGQAFFIKAENEDKLLAYTKNMIAILYRPSTNKIINVAPITINQQQNLMEGTTQKTSTTMNHTHTVAYYNGTKTPGVAASIEKIVNGAYKGYVTKSITNASKDDYSGTLVVDISGAHSEEALELAKLLKGSVGSLPQGETAPNADLLIISGK